MSTPNSASSSRIAFETPGCDVNSALAVSVRLRSRRTASWTNRNWWRFMLSREVRRQRRRRIVASARSGFVLRRSGAQVHGSLRHRVDDGTHFADRRTDSPLHARMARAELADQFRKVLAHMAAGTEKQ